MHNQAPKIDIICETPDFIAINKPAGLLTHKISKSTEEPNLADLVSVMRPETKKVGDNPESRPGIVHRLDKETSGIIIIAKNNDFFAYFKKLLQNKLVFKKYIGLSYGKISKKIEINKPIGIVNGRIKRSTKAKKMRMIKPAITVVNPVESYLFKNNYFTLLHALPLTGRTHQIRVHLASIGSPIVGDKLYGPKTNHFNLERHFLHAASIKFMDQKGKQIKIETELPKDLSDVLTIIKNKGNIAE